MGQCGHPQIRGLPSVIVPRLAALKRVNPVEPRAVKSTGPARGSTGPRAGCSTVSLSRPHDGRRGGRANRGGGRGDGARGNDCEGKTEAAVRKA
jgi:hypothetical protein